MVAIVRTQSTSLVIIQVCMTRMIAIATDDDEYLENICMVDWNLISDPFSDQLPRPPNNFSSEYEFHRGIDSEELKNPVTCFESFISPQIVQKLCDWTNKEQNCTSSKIILSQCLVYSGN